jgi:hypothetical protein
LANPIEPISYFQRVFCTKADIFATPFPAAFGFDPHVLPTSNTGRTMKPMLLLLIVAFACGIHAQIPRSGSPDVISRAKQRDAQRANQAAIDRTLDHTRQQQSPPSSPSVSLPDYRIINGQLYNVTASTNWLTVPKNEWRVGSLEVSQKISGKMAFYTLVPDDQYNLSRRSLILITNFPNENLLTTGQIIPAQRLYRVGTETNQGILIAVYDFGTKPTNGPAPVTK